MSAEGVGGGEDGNAAPLIFLVAGEPSGDFLGARLMAALKAETGGRVRFAGVGGPGMAAQGLRSLVPIEDLAVMGLVEVVPHALRILRLIRTTAAAARAARPAMVVTIDSPSFTLEVSRRLRGLGVPLVHYVAPSVWAWKPWRAAQVARALDHLLVLLPFEPPYFEKHGLPTTFVGHPAVEAAGCPADPAAFRAHHGIPPEAPLVCLLPGSRRGEVRRLAPIFAAALGRLRTERPRLHAVVPTVPSVAAAVAAAPWPAGVSLCGSEERYDAFAAADAGLAASGTVAVELAVAGLPCIIAYRVAPLSARFARRYLRLTHVSLPNILLGREVQPEYLQEACTPERLAEALGRLLDEPSERDRQAATLPEVVRLLRPGEEAPSRRAARVLLGLLGTGAAG